ncbi:MAG: hypothetical protein V1735_04120 [Nanoarchaeota archaeon]
MKPINEWLNVLLEDDSSQASPNPDAPPEEEPLHLDVKFHILERQEDAAAVIADIEVGSNMLFVDFRPFDSRKELYLKTMISHFQRAAHKRRGSVTGYGTGWLIIMPKDVQLIKRKEVFEKKGNNK